MGLHRNGLYQTGLFRAGLFVRGLWTTFKSFFDRLMDLDEPMIVAYEGDDPAETGRYPQEGWVAAFDGGTQYL